MSKTEEMKVAMEAAQAAVKAVDQQLNALEQARYAAEINFVSALSEERGIVVGSIVKIADRDPERKWSVTHGGKLGQVTGFGMAWGSPQVYLRLMKKDGTPGNVALQKQLNEVSLI